MDLDSKERSAELESHNLEVLRTGLVHRGDDASEAGGMQRGLGRNVERIREGAAEGIAKSLEVGLEA